VLDLLKNKSRPEDAAKKAAEWVVSEREMRERLKKERELKEKLAVRVYYHRLSDHPSSASAVSSPYMATVVLTRV
jgi:hypothetical protein